MQGTFSRYNDGHAPVARRLLAQVMVSAVSTASSPRCLIRTGVSLWICVCAIGVATAADDPGSKPIDAHHYIERFVQYVRWPKEEAIESWRVCVPGDEAYDRLRYGDARARGRGFIVETLQSPDQAAGCHVLDLGSADESVQASYLEVVRGKPVLTVGRGATFCTRGGQICLTHGATRQFELNLSAIQGSGLRINARLLTLGLTESEVRP